MRSWDGMFLRTGDCAGSVGAAASGLASDLVLAAAAAAAAAAGIGLASSGVAHEAPMTGPAAGCSVPGAPATELGDAIWPGVDTLR